MDTPPTPNPPTPTPPPAPAPDPGNQDNAVIRQMREAIDQLKQQVTQVSQERDAAASKLKEIETEKLSDAEKLRLQVQELAPAAQRVQAYEQTLQNLVAEEIAGIPEAQRDRVKGVVEKLGVADQLTLVRELKAAMAVAQPPQPPPPTPMGNPANPPAGGTTKTEPTEVPDTKGFKWPTIGSALAVRQS